MQSLNFFTSIILIISAINFLPTSLSSQIYGSGFKPSKKSLFKINKDQKYVFGYLEVPENRALENSNTIQLPVYIFKSRNAKPAKDPVIVLTGGPGNSVMPNAPWMKYWSYLDDRDLILFEQRGTRYAKPHLSCPEWGEAVYQARLLRYQNENSSLFKDEIKQLYESALLKCKSRFEKQKIDLNGYHTNEIAADVEALRLALGLDSFNLLGISYGTKIAQVVMRDFPDGLRSVVMDSPLPLEVSYDDESIDNLLKIYDQYFEACEAQEACNQAYPNLKRRLFSLLDSLNQYPLMLSIQDKQNQETQTFYLSGSDIGLLLGGTSTADVPKIPMRINQILEGDYSLLKSYLTSLSAGNGEGKGMRLSVWCAEEYPYSNQANGIARQDSSIFKGVNGATFLSETCKIWSVDPIEPLANEAVKSDIPVLILNGAYDSVTPARWGTNMLKNLPNGMQIILKGFDHAVTTYWDKPCGMEIARQFFNAPETRPNPDCFKNIEAPIFEVLIEE